MENVEIVAVSDIDEGHIGDKIKTIEGRGAKTPTAYVDFRKMLDDKSIDVDLHRVAESLAHAADDLGGARPARTSTSRSPARTTSSNPSRSSPRRANTIGSCSTAARAVPLPHCRKAIQRMREGEFGEIYMARGLCFKWRDTIGKTPCRPVPPGVDYDLWTGPAPKREFTKNRFHYNWHWFWDTGNGDLGNQGIHEVDIARWGLGVTHPTKVSAIGGKFMFDDDQETPNTITATYEFDVDGKKKMMTFEVRHWISQPRGGHRRREARQHHRQHLLRLEGLPGHRQLQQVLLVHGPGPAARAERDRRATTTTSTSSTRCAAASADDLTAEIEEGALSCNLMHLANISYRLGRTLNWDAKKMQVINDDEANKMLTRAYRAPYVVPKNV